MPSVGGRISTFVGSRWAAVIAVAAVAAAVAVTPVVVGETGAVPCLAADGCFPKPQGSSLPGVTGIPSGTSLTSCGSNVTISTASAVIDSCSYTGKVTVSANNVTIRKSRIPGGVTNGGTNLIIEDSDLGPTTCGSFGDIVAVVKWNNYTIRRSYIHGNSDGLRFADVDNGRVEDSFIQTCVDPSDPDPHMDGIQGNFSKQNFVVDHNTVDIRGCTGCNAPVFFADNAESATITDNLLISPGFSLKVNDDHSPDVGPWVVTGNRLVGGVSTTNTTCSGTGSKMTWTDNRSVTVNSDYTLATTGSLVNC